MKSGRDEDGRCEKKSHCLWLCSGRRLSLFRKMNAQRFNIKGYVENLYDGTVLLEAEGSDDAVDAYLKAVAQGNRYIDVERMETKNIPLEHDREFYIR